MNDHRAVTAVRTAIVVVGIAGVISVMILAAAVANDDSSGLFITANILALAADLTAAGAWYLAHRRAGGLERLAFLCLTLLLLILAMTRVFALQELATSGALTANAGKQLAWAIAACLGVGAVLLLYVHHRERRSWDLLIDSAVVTIAVAILLDQVNAGTSDGLGPLGTLYLALGGGLMVALWTMALWRRSAIRHWMRWMAIALTLLTIDIALSLAADPMMEHPRQAAAAMACGIAASLCAALAALSQRYHAPATPPPVPAPGPRPRHPVLRLLPPLALLGAVALLLSEDGALGLIAIAGCALLVTRLLGTVGTVERLLDERSHWAVTDPLTGAHNRRQLDYELPALAARAARMDTVLSAALLDLDNFKAVNDTHGHGTGDRLLQAVVEAVNRERRAGDPFFRVGGDEFLVLLPGTDASEAVALAERMRLQVRRVAAELLPDGPEVTASIGVVAVLPDRSAPELVLANADRALYAAKDGGRDRVVRICPFDQPEPEPEPTG